MKKGFTLVEMLVVLGILGVLTAVMMGVFSGSTEKAKAAKCLVNMRNLVSAVTVSANDANFQNYIPAAESFENTEFNNSARCVIYKEAPGWINWYSKGSYIDYNESTGTWSRKDVKKQSGSESWHLSAYYPAGSDTERKKRKFCLETGRIWRATNGNPQTFICPSHARILHDSCDKSLSIAWSYVMSERFGWDDSRSKTPKGKGCYGSIMSGSLPRADKALMFAELPFLKLKSRWGGLQTNPPYETSSGDTTTDTVLQYSGNYEESIGFNHKVGNNVLANVAFADGHVEQLMLPRHGLSENQANKLTRWLCAGADVTYNGSDYENLSEATDVEDGEDD